MVLTKRSNFEISAFNSCSGFFMIFTSFNGSNCCCNPDNSEDTRAFSSECVFIAISNFLDTCRNDSTLPSILEISSFSVVRSPKRFLYFA